MNQTIMKFRSQYKNFPVDMVEVADANGNRFYSVDENNKGFATLNDFKAHIRATHFPTDEKVATVFKPGIGYDCWSYQIKDYTVGAYIEPSRAYSYRDGGSFWVKTKSGERLKKDADDLYADTKNNRNRIAEMLRIKQQITKLENKKLDLHDKLVKFKK